MDFSIYEFLYFSFTMIVVIHIWLGARHLYNKDFHGMKIRNLHYSDIQTGDIILTAYSGPESVYHQGVMSMKFIHASICSREGSHVYVYELANYFGEKVGFLKIPFSEWIKYNKNSLMMINKLSIKDDSKRKRNELALKFHLFRESHRMDNDFSFVDYIGRYLVPTTRYKDFDNTRTDYACYELVLNIMKESGIIESMMATEQYVTDDLIDMKRFDLNENFSYEDHYLVDISSLLFISD